MKLFNHKPFFRAGLAATVMLSTVAAAYASPSMDFAYAEANNGTNFFGLSNTLGDFTASFCATKFDAKDLTPFVGNRISHLTVYSPTNEITNEQPDIELFIYVDDISGNPDYSQKARISRTQKTSNLIKLDSPMEIEAGKSYYVGYRLEVPSLPFYYIPVDLISAAPERCISAVIHTDGYPDAWDFIGDEYGSLCIGLTITGDKLPNNWAAITSASYPSYIAPSATGSFELTVENKGISPIESVTVSSKCSDGSSPELTGFPEKPISVGESATVKFEGLKFNAEGYYEITSVITKVNGKQARDNASVSGSVMVYNGGYQRQMVVEEAGGAWCQWCPAGIVMMDNIRKNYPENFNLISVHQGDDLDLPAYYPFLKKYFTDFPASIFNRVVKYNPALGHSEEYTREFVKSLYDHYMSYPAVGKVDFSFKPTPDGKTIKVSAEAEFALDLDRQYLLSFVLTEDNVGPYTQANAYHTGDYGVMGGWENLDSYTSCVYNDVPKDIVGFPGIEGSLPSSVRKGQKYAYSCNLSLSRVTGGNWRVIAMLTDAATGEIVNSSQVLSDTYKSSINDAIDDGQDNDVRISVSNGVLSVEGANEVAVYSAGGQLVSTSPVVNLPRGLYIVHAGNYVHKVVMK